MSDVFQSLNPAPLDTQIVGSRVLVFPVVDSTNDRAFAVGADGAVVVADAQTAGRGRHGKGWASAPGLGLWFSVFLKGEVMGLPFAGPLAVMDAFQEYYPDAQRVLRGKWPNDLLLGGKKCCGTLVEKRPAGVVIGVGINVLHREEDFPTELRDRATSFLAQMGYAPERISLFRSVLHALDRYVCLLRTNADGADRLSTRWFNVCRMRGRSVIWRRGQGIIEGIDPTGALYVRHKGTLTAVPYDDSVKVMSKNQGDAA